ncbi:MAG: hypothetical protein JRJ43_09900 [Deltaproteobacteria bacterium]|nr:hypothetical protein [Deltaproteobacteria bacterium]MBW1719857.1 hypothetical protein [Deltaproteobacteria bacterium]MBW1938756.1 hypothetical protein [Deltaproteobacteria bacterium]
MNLSKDMNKLFIDELNFVLQHMKATDKSMEKLYFFSGIFAVANRIFNIESHPELVFIHNVVKAAHDELQANLIVQFPQQRPAFGIPEDIFDGLEAAIEEMITRISSDQDIYSSLQKISNIAYSTTGNGRYLRLKGMLTI